MKAEHRKELQTNALADRMGRVIQRMKQRDPELSKGWVQIVHTLSVPTDGGPQPMLCANTEGLFRIIQSIPSLKAEPFKRWLAKVGYERIQEIEDPEHAPFSDAKTWDRSSSPRALTRQRDESREESSVRQPECCPNLFS